MSVIDRMIDASVVCLKCGTVGMGNCDCYEKCSCGWWTDKGKPCRNPKATRCSTKMMYGAVPVDRRGEVKPSDYQFRVGQLLEYTPMTSGNGGCEVEVISANGFTRSGYHRYKVKRLDNGRVLNISVISLSYRESPTTPQP